MGVWYIIENNRVDNVIVADSEEIAMQVGHTDRVLEETEDTDRTRGGNAKETKIVEISSDEGTLYPLGGIRIVVRVFYEFVRGTS